MNFYPRLRSYFGIPHGLVHLLNGFLLLAGLSGVGCANAQSTRPCDILGPSSSTACVSAYSTIRSLSSSYTGNLYQVTRGLDNTTQNIGTLSDGFANAAIQDAFCALTTCTITEIYDQSGNGNNFTVAPPGGEDAGTGSNQYDLPASATLLPVIAGGHKVYGFYVPPGAGYRDDAAQKTAVGNQAQGVYMVTTGLNLTNRCCFDFGNAEIDNHDDGPSTMDALNITNPGSGGAVGFDLEQGAPDIAWVYILHLRFLFLSVLQGESLPQSRSCFPHTHLGRRDASRTFGKEPAAGWEHPPAERGASIMVLTAAEPHEMEYHGVWHR